MIKVSIIICTRDRAEQLHATLRSVGSLKVPDDMPTQVLIVDNGSVDRTLQVVNAFHPTNGLTVRYLCERSRGKGFAYNAGLRASEGDVLLFTDDDVQLPTNWIQGLVTPIVEGRGDAVAGGVVLAAHLERPWLTALMRAFLATTERLDPKSPWSLVGANMGFHRRVFNAVPTFDVELGPGTLYGVGDETLLAEQVKTCGMRIAGALDVKVVHHCDASRLQRKALLDMARKVGRSEAYVYWHWNHNQVSWSALKLIWGSSAYVLRSWRKMLLKASDAEGNVSDDELKRVRAIAFLLQYRRETHRLRNYERHGLLKVAGLQSRPPVRWE